LLPDVKLDRPVRKRSDGSLSAINLATIGDISRRVRELLLRFSPELVSSAEAFSKHVWFIPVSATGRAPQKDPQTGIVGVRPRDVRPVWCDVPLAAVISQHGQGLIPFVDQE
jgi:hypothetical protein